MAITSEKYLTVTIYLTLALITLAVFGQVRNFDFINYDDQVYISENEHISSGFTCDNIRWAFTNQHGGNWHPLTSLSLVLDCELFSLNPSRHHLVNLLFHIANTLLLFFVLKKMTAAIWQSAFVAALFAIHPLHVESVAWISQRKDVLSTFFWLLTMAAYFRYVKNQKPALYTLTILLFALGLMAKPMLVTMPFVLLLLDYWPLKRLERKTLYKRILEKLPFFILAAASSTITFLVQTKCGALSNIKSLPLSVRSANAIVAYAQYFLKMVWPAKLAFFYPHLGDKLPFWQVFTAAILLLVTTIAVIRFAAKHKYLPVGWFWFLGTLIPVVGLVQVGAQSMADRYTYVTLIGLFIIIAWLTADISAKWKFRKIILGSASLAVIFTLSVCAFFQASYWKNDLTLSEHALKVTKENYVAHNIFGTCLLKQDKFDEAIDHFQKTLKISPNYEAAFFNIGVARGKLGQTREELKAYLQAINANPDYAEAHYNLGVALERLSRYEPAIHSYQQALKIKPTLYKAYVNLGNICIELARKAQHLPRTELLIKAKDKYLSAESIKTGSAAYNLACVNALIGDTVQCQKWLKLAEQAETLPAKERAATDIDLETVRDKDWFGQLRWPDANTPSPDR